MGPVLNQVMGPEMVPVGRSQANAGPVIQPGPAAFRLFPQDFQPVAPPFALHPLAADMPAVSWKKPVNAPVAATPVTGGQANDRPCQDILIGTALPQLALCRAVLAEHRAGTALGNPQLPDHSIDPTPAARRAPYFTRQRLVQDQLVPCQIGNRLAEPGILLLQLFQPMRLTNLRTAVLTAPAMVTLFRYQSPRQISPTVWRCPDSCRAVTARP